ncbi:hypothetical protein CORT_0C06600 [Candida orthopsilosis Co 90-125]|uniref:Uncharacterized protein n=1 Tax=Candida orthopsilosis (strain 90-125) TaxID=1136231 RepID=H8X481_CANO9|nr:hypothetical protein CORT_0C06600 [Candida orthopsilosis Co 90-125]CCG26033.1 hypothetical protein CORT_0C06600 [Candida orthopsilosis Co 90-125]
MRSLFVLLSLFFATFVFAQTGDVDLVSRAIARRADEPTQEELEEVDQYLKQLVAAVTGNTTKRDNPALTAAFTALNKSGTGVQIVHSLATNSLSQGTTIKAVEEYVSNTGLTTLLEAADNSGLAVSVVMRFFINYSLIPALWDIIVALYNNGVISVKRLDLLGIIGSVLGSVQESIWSSVITLVNLVADPESICESLNKSGLGVSVVDDLFSTSDGKSFLIKLITALVNDGVVTLGILLDALRESSFLQNTFTKVLSSSTNRKIIFIWAVNNLVSLIKYIF